MAYISGLQDGKCWVTQGNNHQQINRKASLPSPVGAGHEGAGAGFGDQRACVERGFPSHKLCGFGRRLNLVVSLLMCLQTKITAVSVP